MNNRLSCCLLKELAIKCALNSPVFRYVTVVLKWNWGWNANDGILYAGSLTDDKDLINTKATSKVGDFVVCASLNSTTHWTIVDVQGVFAKEA